jgi:N-acetylglucosamine-6-phosphate deacetylase
MILIKNGTLITPDRTVDSGNILIKGSVIEEVTQGAPAAERYGGIPGLEVIDARGLYVTPGFIDIHVHGGGGRDTTEGAEEAVIHMARAHARFGTTGIVPACSAAPMDELLKSVDAIKAAQKKAPTILGAHLEGPFFSVGQKGAQNEEYIKNPADVDYEPLLDRWDKILMMSAAPELPGGMELGRALRRRGILASVGHSDADYDVMELALENGYSHVTHLYSGCSIVRRINAFRVAGVVESAFLLDGYSVEIIADGKHLPPPLLKLIYKIKGPERISLITDGVRYSACEIKEGTVFRESGMDVIYEDGVMKLLSREAFAGSAATANKLVYNMTRLAGVPLACAVKMACLSPARALGLERRKGRLGIGYDADIVIFDDSIQINKVLVGGKVYCE